MKINASKWSGLSSDWCLILRAVSHQGSFSSGGWSVIMVVCHHGGCLLSVWFVIRVVTHSSTGWSLIRVVSDYEVVCHHEGRLLSVWFVIRVVTHQQGGLSSGWSLIMRWSVIMRVGGHQGGLSSRWSLIRIVFHHEVVSHHEGGLPSGWSLIMGVVFRDQCGLSPGWSLIAGSPILWSCAYLVVNTKVVVICAVKLYLGSDAALRQEYALNSMQANTLTLDAEFQFYLFQLPLWRADGSGLYWPNGCSGTETWRRR